jgi:enoyl-CoA hydratase/carnithine racemase
LVFIVVSAISAMASLPLTFPLGGPKSLIKVSSSDSYYLLSYTNPPDNRYTSEFIDASLEALAYLRTHCKPKPLITTSSIPKFFSNGLDFEVAIRTPNFFRDKYFKLMRAYLEFPWPTIALVNGHAFAAAFMLAACNDYRVMNPNRGFVCLNELDFGAILKAPMISIFKVKFGGQVTQKIALTAHRFTGKEALEYKLVDVLGGLPEAEQIAGQVAKFASSPVYGAIRQELLKEVVLDTLNTDNDVAETADRQINELEYYDSQAAQIDKKLAKL